MKILYLLGQYSGFFRGIIGLYNSVWNLIYYALYYSCYLDEIYSRVTTDLLIRDLILQVRTVGLLHYLA